MTFDPSDGQNLEIFFDFFDFENFMVSRVGASIAAKVGPFDELSRIAFDSVKDAKAALEWSKRVEHDLIISYVTYGFCL